MARRIAPPPTVSDAGRNDYLRRLFLSMKSRTTLKEWLIRAIQQSGRLLLALLIGFLFIESSQSWSQDLQRRSFFMTEAAVFLSGGFGLLLVELLCVMARSVFRLPSRGTETMGIGIAARAFLAACFLFSIAAANRHASGFALEAVVALTLFGWNVPAAWHSLRDLGVGLRSVPQRRLAVSPGALTARGPARLGRQIVVGRALADGLGVEGEGAMARVVPEDAAWLIDVESVRTGAIAIVGEASSDGDGYRGAGVRLTAGGLPMWILDGQDAAPRLHAYARGLRLAQLLDRAVVGSSIVIAGAMVGVALSIWSP